MSALSFDLDPPGTGPARLGLVVLRTDEVIEQDFRRLFPPGPVALHVTRIPSGAEVTGETLAAMEAELPRAAGLLPQTLEFAALGYACTSGATVIGPERVAALLRAAVRARAVSDPLSAALAGFAALGVRRIGLVSPYVAPVSAAMRAAMQAAGFEIAGFGSFEEVADARVARISGASVREAALAVGADRAVQAVFLSCTNLRTLDQIAPLEAALGKPVMSSNQALGWHMARLAGAPVAGEGFGRLMAAG